MKFPRLYCLLLINLWLFGCASSQVKEVATEKIDWQQQQQALQQIKQWSINGRIAVQTNHDGGQADYRWQQLNTTDYNIRLQAPLGAGTTWINGDAQGVSLQTSSGDALFDVDVDKLMRQINGWPLPVSGLRYWVLGLPSVATAYSVSEWKSNGLPGVMLQDGWRIEFRRYKKVSGILVPHKLFIRRADVQDIGDLENNEEDIDVRLIIRQWSIGHV
jgi:outer membrane lipoprotein LolB